MCGAERGRTGAAGQVFAAAERHSGPKGQARSGRPLPATAALVQTEQKQVLGCVSVSEVRGADVVLT
eukprot:2751418-Rhodomonas_salina.2